MTINIAILATAIIVTGIACGYLLYMQYTKLHRHTLRHAAECRCEELRRQLAMLGDELDMLNRRHQLEIAHLVDRATGLDEAKPDATAVISAA